MPYTHEQQEGYYALYISIMAEMTPEEAFYLLETGEDPASGRSQFTTKDTEDMLAMRREGWTNKEIAALYGVRGPTISRRVTKLLQDRQKGEIDL